MDIRVNTVTETGGCTIIYLFNLVLEKIVKEIKVTVDFALGQTTIKYFWAMQMT